jgi:hypothetical protein
VAFVHYVSCVSDTGPGYTCHVVSVKGEDVLKIGLLFFARGAIVAVGEQAKCLARFARYRTFLGRCTESQSTSHVANRGGLGAELSQHTDWSYA